MNPEGSPGKADQDLKKFASSVQGCRLARLGPSDGRPHINTIQTPAPVLGWAGDDNSLKLPDNNTIRFGSIRWTGGLEQCRRAGSAGGDF